MGVGLDVPGSDKRGGANGARIRLEPQKSWEVNDPAQLAKVLETLEGIRSSFGQPISLADLIVLAGGAAVEQAAADGGMTVEVPFTAGRVDASQDQTDAVSFEPLEPSADGFRNWDSGKHRLPAEYLLLDRANLLTLSAPEMTVLVGGLRVLGANAGGSTHGVLTDRPGTLTNDFFVNLLDLGTAWTGEGATFEARDGSGAVRWTGPGPTSCSGPTPSCGAVAEVYASDDAREKFVGGLRRRVDEGHGPRPLRPGLGDGSGRPLVGRPGQRLVAAGRKRSASAQPAKSREPMTPVAVSSAPAAATTATPLRPRISTAVAAPSVGADGQQPDRGGRDEQRDAVEDGDVDVQAAQDHVVADDLRARGEHDQEDDRVAPLRPRRTSRPCQKPWRRWRTKRPIPPIAAVIPTRMSTATHHGMPSGEISVKERIAASAISMTTIGSSAAISTFGDGLCSGAERRSAAIRTPRPTFALKMFPR